MGCGMSGGNSVVCVGNERDLKGSVPRKEVVSCINHLDSFEIYSIKSYLFSQNFIHVRFNQKILAPVRMLFGFIRPSA